MHPVTVFIERFRAAVSLQRVSTVAADDKISTAIARRAVRRRQQSFLYR